MSEAINQDQKMNKNDVSDPTQDVVDPQQRDANSPDSSQDANQDDSHIDKKDAIISSLRKENASWRVKLRELEKRIDSKSSDPSNLHGGNPEDKTQDNEWQKSYNKLANSHRRILVRDLAKEKGVDPEVLEAVAQKRGIDVLADEGYTELEELIKEKKWGRKAASEFGYSGSTRSSAENTQPKTINDAVGRLFTSK